MIKTGDVLAGRPYDIPVEDVIQALCKYLKVDVRVSGRAKDAITSAPMVEIHPRESAPKCANTGMDANRYCPEADNGHLLSAKELNQRLIEIGKILRGEKEDEPNKKQPSSCLSCRFCQRESGGKRFTCHRTFVEQCFDGPVTFDSEAVAKYDFFCTFHEYKPEEDYHWRTYGDDGSPKEEKRAFHTGTTGGLSPNSGAGETGKMPYNADDCD